MAGPGAANKKVSNTEALASIEAIGRLHHILKGIDGSLVLAKGFARVLLDNAHALPGGLPREAAVAVARLRLEVAHGDALTVETLRALVGAVPVPQVRLQAACETSGAVVGGRAATAAVESTGPLGVCPTSAGASVEPTPIPIDRTACAPESGESAAPVQ